MEEEPFSQKEDSFLGEQISWVQITIFYDFSCFTNGITGNIADFDISHHGMESDFSRQYGELDSYMQDSF